LKLFAFIGIICRGWVHVFELTLSGRSTGNPQVFDHDQVASFTLVIII